MRHRHSGRQLNRNSSHRKAIVANRRLAFDRLRNKDTVGKLFAELGPRYEGRPGGYLRILKCGLRTGDKAPMAYVELVDRPAPIVEDDAVEEASED